MIKKGIDNPWFMQYNKYIKRKKEVNRMVNLIVENLDEEMAEEVRVFIKQKKQEKEEKLFAEEILENIKEEIKLLKRLGFDLRKNGYTQWRIYDDEIIITKR